MIKILIVIKIVELYNTYECGEEHKEGGVMVPFSKGAMANDRKMP